VLSTDARGRSGISCSSCIGARKTIETLARSKILAEEALENFRKEKQRLLIEVKGLDLSLRTALKNTYRKEQFTCGEEVWNEKIDSAPIDAIKLRVNADKEKRRREKAEEARKEQEARKAIFERREKERERMAAAAATAREKQTVAIKKEDMEQKVLEHQQKIEEQVTARNTRLKASRDAMKAKALEEQKPTVAIKQEKTLKRKASILISCQNCGKDFDEEKNKKGACSAHSGIFPKSQP
jgi:flagellar biosynthesis GTPase FlhF